MRRTSLLVALLLAPALAGATDPTDTRAAELAKLRREVETLSAEVTAKKEDVRTRVAAIEAQSLEVEVQIRREELRLAQLDGEADARRAELAVHTGQSAALVPPLVTSIATIRATVERGLPFRTTERLAELDRLQEQLEDGLLPPEQAAARLWAFTEDELRLARENGLDRQVVPLPIPGAGGPAPASGEVLADVARLGMVALYFRTDGGVVGAAVRQGDTWTWTVFDDRDDQVAVERLFEKMHHGVRTGAFTLPNPESGS